MNGAPMSRSGRQTRRSKFLGDAVVGLVAGGVGVSALSRAFRGSADAAAGCAGEPQAPRGGGRGLSLGKYLLLGTRRERSGGRTKMALLATPCEAVIGAVYLDAGHRGGAAAD